MIQKIGDFNICNSNSILKVLDPGTSQSRGGGYSTLSWVRMCGPKFRPPPYNKTREDANLLPISKPFVSWRALFKTNQCFLQCKLGCISTFWQPIDKPKDKFIGNYAFCKNATYIKTNFQIKKGPLQNLRARKSTLWPHIPVPTFPLSTPGVSILVNSWSFLGVQVLHENVVFCVFFFFFFFFLLLFSLF